MLRTELLIMVNDFIKSHTIKDDLLGEYLDFLHEEADTPQKKQMLNETLQRSMR